MLFYLSPRITISNDTFNTEEKLPKYICLSNDLGKMRLRGFPAVMRIHTKKKGHEKLYSELLLYSSWRHEESEFYPDDEVLCAEEYKKRVIQKR